MDEGTEVAATSVKSSQPPSKTFTFSVPWESWELVLQRAKPRSGNTRWMRADRTWRDIVIPQLELLNPHCRIGLSGVNFDFRSRECKGWSGYYGSTKLSCVRRPGKAGEEQCDVSYEVRIMTEPVKGEEVEFVVTRRGGDPAQTHSSAKQKELLDKSATFPATLALEAEELSTPAGESAAVANGSPVAAPSFGAPRQAHNSRLKTAARNIDPVGMEAEKREGVGGTAKQKKTSSYKQKNACFTDRRHLIGARRTELLEDGSGVPQPTPSAEPRRLLTGARRKALLREAEEFPGSLREFVVGKKLEGAPVPTLNALRQLLRHARKKKSSEKPCNIESGAVKAGSSGKESTSLPNAASVEELIEVDQAEEDGPQKEQIEELSESKDATFQATMICDPSEKEKEDVELSSTAEELVFEYNLFAPPKSNSSSGPVQSLGGETSNSNLTIATGPQVEISLSDMGLGSLVAESEAYQRDSEYSEAAVFVLKPTLFTPEVEPSKPDSAAETSPEKPSSEAFTTCALCSSKIPVKTFETHLRLELAYFVFRCCLCSASFVDRQQAELHFRSLFAAHPEEPVALAEHRDLAKDQRLHQLLTQSASL